MDAMLIQKLVSQDETDDDEVDADELDDDFLHEHDDIDDELDVAIAAEVVIIGWWKLDDDEDEHQ